jgi:flavin-dependent dehydrogenase
MTATSDVRRDAFDVAVVGASIAGCTAARLFARAGARVALIERRADPGAYKVACTHAFLPAATPAIDRLGLAPLLEARGAVRTQAEFWTPYGGWFRAPADFPDGYGITRRTLDPILRELAVGTPGVEFLAGSTAVRLLADDGRPAGVEVERPDHQTRAVRARLVVGADGRGSTIARLARVPGRVRAHNRFFYFAYWRGIRPRTTRVRLWLTDPDGAAQFPNEDDLTVMVAAPHRSRLPEFRADLEGAYTRMVSSLPDGPDLSQAERTSKLIGKLDMPNVIRPAARSGVALIGDAALATDPLFGIGCTWAFQSAEWLVDETAQALVDGSELDDPLRRYRRKFLWRLGPHHLQIADYATGRKTRPLERVTFRAATTDPAIAQVIADVIGLRRSPLHLFGPRFTARMLRAAARDRRGHPPPAGERRDH